MKTIGLLLLIAAFAFVAAPSYGAVPPPATGPKEGEDTLLDGEIIFTPPEGWQELTRDAKSIQYNSPDHKGTIVIAVSPQEINLNKNVADQLGMQIKKKMVEGAKASNSQFVVSPRVEKDDLLFLKIHDRMKKGDAIADRLTMYQMVSLNLVTVISVANSDVEEEITSLHKPATDLLLSARFQKLDLKTGQRVPVKPKRPTTLPKNYWKAHVRILGPTGWKEEMKDNASGEIAVFTDPQHGDVKITVEVESLPSGVSAEDPRVEKMADVMIDRREQTAKRAGREIQGETESLEDPAYVRRTRSRYSGKPQPTVVSLRVLNLGNALANVITEAPADQSARVEKLADEWAKENITPMGTRELQRQEKKETPATRSSGRPESPAP